MGVLVIWMSECGLYVCHKKNSVYVCVLVKTERERNSTANHKSKHCVHQRCCAASNGENVVLRPNNILPNANFFEISTSNLQHNLLTFMALIF